MSSNQLCQRKPRGVSKKQNSSKEVMMTKNQFDFTGRAPGLDEHSDDEFEAWEILPVDLNAYEEKLGKLRPIFTRKRIETYSRIRDRILKDKSFKWCCEPNPLPDIEKNDLHSTWCIWKRQSAADNFVTINFLTSVEMHPSMHAEGLRTDKLKKLHHYNQGNKTEENDLILTPAVIHSFPSPAHPSNDKDHLDDNTMTWWRMQMDDIRHAWETSRSHAQLNNSLEGAKPWAVPIKKIVCFGLGSLRREKPNKPKGSSDDFQEVLEHMTAFSIARKVNAMNRAADPAAPAHPIPVVLQDPLYTPKDKILLREEYPEGVVEFVDDPDGYLEVDEHTLVMTAYLYLSVPLMQICADLVRPAGFICDRMERDPAKRAYTFLERASPRVVAMLGEYRCRGFADHAVEGKLMGVYARGCPYWLWEMEFFMRPKDAE